jgi:AbiA family abortive infection protein
MKNTPPRLDDFLSLRDWQEAINLLDFQINQKKKHRHYNTLSMYYYEKLMPYIGYVKSANYFNEKVANNLFYALEDEFVAAPYLVPKSGLSLRNYRFFSYPMRALYYAIGLYLFRVSNQFIHELTSDKKNIKSYYGASLSLSKGDLVISPNNTYFKRPYKNFRSQMRKELDDKAQNKVVLHLDVHDFFDSVDVPTLLELLRSNVSYSTKQQMLYTAETIEQIKFFFQHLSPRKNGIPQYENDIISSFIGYLYLFFADLQLDSHIIKHGKHIVENHRIIRYVDDIYISLELRDGFSLEEKENFIDTLSSRFADILYHKFHLRLNTKTRLYWLDNEEDVEDLKRALKKVSSQYQINDDENELSLDEKLEMIFEEVEQLKTSRIDKHFMQDRSVQDEILKEVFDKRIDQLMEKNENKLRIRYLFDDFNFNLVRASPLEITIVLLKDEFTAKRYRSFLLQKQYVTTVDVNLILEYLCQTGFTDTELIEKLQKNAYMERIITWFTSKFHIFYQPGYHGLGDQQVTVISSMPHVIEQARLRIMSERLRNYSVALNHLLNEFHGVCLEIDPAVTSHKEYDVNDIKAFLASKNVPNEICIDIRNMFDRRNNNQVSHPGFQNIVTWSVNESEYQEYRLCVSLCLKEIL